MSLDELRYYRNLLALKVDDEVEWRINQRNPTSPLMRGTIIDIYPEGKGQYTGIQHAFITVFSARGGPRLNYSVLLTNPTLKKLETDK